MPGGRRDGDARGGVNECHLHAYERVNLGFGRDEMAYRALPNKRPGVSGSVNKGFQISRRRAAEKPPVEERERFRERESGTQKVPSFFGHVGGTMSYPRTCWVRGEDLAFVSGQMTEWFRVG